MIRKFKQKDIVWLDVESPSKEDIFQLAEDYNLHSLVTNELIVPSHESHVDAYEKYLYLVIHFPLCEVCYGAERDKDTQEIDFILGRDFLITIHYEPIQTLGEFGKIFEAQFRINEDHGALHAGYLFHHIMKEMYISLEAGMDFIKEELKRAEKKVFSGKEKDMVVALAAINRNLLDFYWALKPHIEIINSLELAIGHFFDSKFSHYVRAIRTQFYKIYETMIGNREMFREIKETNDSLLTIKTNEIMKVLTLMAFITFPLSVFTSIFGMNTKSTPILGHPYDFWIIIAIMFSAVLTMFIIFKYKRWL